MAAAATEGACIRDEPQPTTARKEVLGRRPAWIVATLAAASVVAHVWMLNAHAHGAAMTVLVIAMALWCAWCAAEATLRPGVSCLLRLSLMSLAMVAVHLVMVLPPGGADSGHGHHHAAGLHLDAAGSASAAGTHTVALLSIIGVELLVSLACAISILRRRGRP